MPRPIVLVHGAWHGAWCWDRVVQALRERGCEAEAVELPFTGVDDDVAAVRERLASLPGSVVCGHSYGGVVITYAASGLDVGHLVYLCAFNPDSGETLAALMAMAPPTPLMGGMVNRADGTTTVDPAVARDAFYADCDPTEAEDAIAHLRPIRFTAGELGDVTPAWRSIPSTYVVCSEDRALAPELQRTLAKRATRRVEWQVSHSPFVSRPSLVVDLLADLAG